MWLLNKCGRDLCCVLLLSWPENRKPWASVVTWGLPYLFVGFLNALKVDFLDRWGWAQFPRSLNRGTTELRWDKPDTCLYRFSVWVWLVSHAQKPSFHPLTEHNICLDQKTGRRIAPRRRLSLSGTFPSSATNGNQGDEAEQRGLNRKDYAGEEEHECHVCRSGARKQRGKGQLNAVWPDCGQRCPFPVGDSRKTVRAENQGQCTLTLSPEDGILVTDLSRTFPMVHLLEWNPTINMFWTCLLERWFVGKLGR